MKNNVSQCLTTPESPQNPNSPCILPFRFNGRLENQCILDVTTGNYWCPTKLNSDGDYIFNKDSWGFCGSSCPPMKTIPSTNRDSLSSVKLSTTTNKPNITTNTTATSPAGYIIS